MPDAKFESGSFSSFGDMMSQIFPLKRETSHKNSDIYPRKIDLTLKNEFYVQIRSSRPKIDPMSISAIFKQRKFFSFSKFWDVSMSKGQQQPP